MKVWLIKLRRSKIQSQQEQYENNNIRCYSRMRKEQAGWRASYLCVFVRTALKNL